MYHEHVGYSPIQSHTSYYSGTTFCSSYLVSMPSGATFTITQTRPRDDEPITSFAFHATHTARKYSRMKSITVPRTTSISDFKQGRWRYLGLQIIDRVALESKVQLSSCVKPTSKSRLGLGGVTCVDERKNCGGLPSVKAIEAMTWNQFGIYLQRGTRKPKTIFSLA